MVFFDQETFWVLVPVCSWMGWFWNIKFFLHVIPFPELELLISFTTNMNDCICLYQRSEKLTSSFKMLWKERPFWCIFTQLPDSGSIRSGFIFVCPTEKESSVSESNNVKSVICNEFRIGILNNPFLYNDLKIIWLRNYSITYKL